MYKKLYGILLISVLTFNLQPSTFNLLFAQEKIKLEYRLSKGDVSKYKIILSNNIEKKGIVNTKAERTIIDQTINADYTQEVTGISLDGTMDIAGTFTSFNLSMKKNDKEELIPEEIFKSFAGKKFFYRLAKKGEILDFSPPQYVFGAPFTTDLLTLVFEHLQPHLPESEINIGTTWLSNLEVSAPRPAEGKIFGNFSYTLEKIEKIGKISCATIAFWGTLTSSLTAKRGDTILEMNIIGSSEGKTHISLADGKLVKTDENLTLNIITGTTYASAGKTETTHLQTIIKTDVNGELQQ